MIVWRSNNPSAGNCEVTNGQAVVDWNVDNCPTFGCDDDSIRDHILDSAFDLGYYGLVDSFLIVDDGTAPDYADFVINSCAANTNPRAYLYLYD